VRQIAIISGKGGTGKTSVIASLAALAKGRAAIADCDVDAPDLHIILRPEIMEKREFMGIKRAVIDTSRCTLCSSCEESCHLIRQWSRPCYFSSRWCFLAAQWLMA
jgi:MinD superfamily P-loop ATPase